MTTDVVLDRIKYDPPTGKDPVTNIPWPDGLAPKDIVLTDHSKLPQCDVLVITWTAAEAKALADVLTPGTTSAAWTYYKTDFSEYESLLTGRSPARESKRLGSWCLTGIGGKRVLCFKSELHPATDGPTVPTSKLVAQIVKECNPSAVITTGTAGGAGDGTQLGDVNVASVVHADFTTKLKSWPHSTQEWATSPLTEKNMEMIAASLDLLKANIDKIPAQPKPPNVWTGHTVSTDFFAFDTETDHFGLRKYDPQIRAVEMDDAAVFAGLPSNMAAYSVRNASDPVMPGQDEKQDDSNAAEIYKKYGYWTTVNSAILVWALVTGMN